LIAGAVIILAALMWQCGSALFEARGLSYPAVAGFHSHLNGGEYEEICSEADEEFAPPDKHERAIHFLDSLHRKLGEAGASNLVNVNVTRNMKGLFVTATFSTTFAQGEGQEQFVWRKSGHSLRLYSYHITSDALMK
jgi:hypothetical protein